MTYEEVDYSETFGNPFTTRHNLTNEQTAPIIEALHVEVAENLVYDHWHPEIAGYLQMAIHFLQTRSKNGNIMTEIQSAKLTPEELAEHILYTPDACVVGLDGARSLADAASEKAYKKGFIDGRVYEHEYGYNPEGEGE